MGAEVWLKLAKGQLKRIRQYLPLDDGGLVWVGVNGEWGCWIDFTHQRLEVGYSHSFLNGEAANYIAREIAKRFEITRFGHDHVGWYDDVVWTREPEKRPPHGTVFECYGKYERWSDWIKDYKPEWNHDSLYARANNLEPSVDLKELQEIDEYVKAHFIKLDETLSNPVDCA